MNIDLTTIPYIETFKHSINLFNGDTIDINSIIVYARELEKRVVHRVDFCINRKEDGSITVVPRELADSYMIYARRRTNFVTREKLKALEKAGRLQWF